MSELPLRQKAALWVVTLATIAAITWSAQKALAQGGAELTPIVRVNPKYPPRALSRGNEGIVTLRFTITIDGTTKDIEIVESSSSSFERPAIEALSKWRYSAQAMERRGVETVIRFDP
jgi:protein TonB